MAIFVEGRIMAFVLFAGCFVVFYYLIDLAKKGKSFYIRNLPAIDAIEELIGRSLETGRPLLFTSGGTGSLSDSVSTQLISAVGILSHVSNISAKLDANLIVVEPHPDLLPLVVETVETSYTMEGKKMPPETVQYIPRGFSYTGGVTSIMMRERVAATVMVGPFIHEAILFAATGAEVGAMQIGGTARSSQIPYMAVMCDYSLIGEDLYAAGAFINREPEAVGTLVGEDIFKIIISLVIIMVLILTTFNISWLTDIIKL